MGAYTRAGPALQKKFILAPLQDLCPLYLFLNHTTCHSVVDSYYTDMWHKFQGASYTRWENIDEAIRNCTPVNDFGEKYGLEQRSAKCWTILDCALSAADAIQQAQFSSAATILGLVCSPFRLYLGESDTQG